MQEGLDAEDEESYEFDAEDHAILVSTKQLIAKVLASNRLSDAKRSVVRAIGNAFAELPDTISDLTATFTLIGPERHFGEHRINHHWTVEVAGEDIQVDAGGYFYRPTSGGDSFTSFMWSASLGNPTQREDFSSALKLVDDAKPFDVEIDELDVTQPGYSVQVTLDGNEVSDDEEFEDDELEDEVTDDSD